MTCGTRVLAAFLFLNTIAAWAQPRIVSRVGHFGITDALPRSYRQEPLYVVQFIARTTGLYFLMAPGPVAGLTGTFILHTDVEGTYRKVLPLNIGFLSGCDVDDEGQIYVFQTGRDSEGERKVNVYDTQANELDTIPLPVPVIGSCVVDGTPVIASRDGFLYVLGREGLGRVTGTIPGRRFLMSALADGRFVLVNRTAAEISLGDLANGVERSFVLNAPEIDQSRLTYEGQVKGKGNVRGVIVNSLATTADEDIYVTVMGHQLADGAPVLRLDKDGNVLERLRYLLPGSPKDGYMFPSHIGVVGERVFLVGGGDLEVAVYPR